MQCWFILAVSSHFCWPDYFFCRAHHSPCRKILFRLLVSIPLHTQNLVAVTVRFVPAHRIVYSINEIPECYYFEIFVCFVFIWLHSQKTVCCTSLFMWLWTGNAEYFIKYTTFLFGTYVILEDARCKRYYHYVPTWLFPWVRKWKTELATFLDIMFDLNAHNSLIKPNFSIPSNGLNCA